MSKTHLLLLPESKETDAGYFDRLKSDTWDISENFRPEYVFQGGRKSTGVKRAMAGKKCNVDGRAR